MNLKYIERIWNKPAPPHDIYREPCSGLYGECFNVDGELTFSDIPLCEVLEALRNIINEYDKWLLDFSKSNHNTKTSIALSNHNARLYWRAYKLHHKEYNIK